MDTLYHHRWTWIWYNVGKVMQMAKILLVEDDQSITMGLEYALTQEGYEVDVADLIEVATKLHQENHYDMYLLDINLPDGNGLDFCRTLRETTSSPVIFLTASDQETNMVTGFEIGGDDYITKPFRIKVLLGRIKAILRRSESQLVSMVNVGNLKINLQSAKVYKDDIEVVLTTMEYKLLLTFIQNPNQVLSRETLLEGLWEFGSEYVNDNTLTVYIKRLREKIEENPSNPQLIVTVRGLGYRLNV